jgi:hypothetical protein
MMKKFFMFVFCFSPGSCILASDFPFQLNFSDLNCDGAAKTYQLQRCYNGSHGVDVR